MSARGVARERGWLRRCGARALWGLLAVATTLPITASASRPRLRLERIDNSRCARERLLVAYASELELEGELRSRSPSEYALWAGSRQVAARPQGATTFAATGEPLQLALVVALGAAFREAMPALREGAASLAQSLPAGSRLTLLGYTDEVRRFGSRLTPQRARSAVEALSSAERPSDPALVEALALALRSLAEPVAGADTTAAGVATARARRRALVVVSDGIDRQPDWEAFRAIGRRARRQGIPIHPIAYSPFDARGPLLNLGELAKRSSGTLRWARSVGGLTAAFEQLARELSDQLVLTFHWDDCARATPLSLAAGGLRSSAVLAAAGPLSAAGVRARRVPLPWRILLVVLIVALAATGLVLLTRALLRAPRRQP